MRATKDGDHYVLNGSKMWITNSYEAEIFLVFATVSFEENCCERPLTRAMKVDPSAGYKGITCFVVDKSDGIQIAKKEQKLGIRASSTCTLSFDGVRIPATNVIGEVGKGYKVTF
jgi:short-chain 2-methylacyl-CoA dehydrogenase